MEDLLHGGFVTSRICYMEDLLHRGFVTWRICYMEDLLHGGFVKSIHRYVNKPTI